MTLLAAWAGQWRDRAFRIESTLTMLLLVGAVSALARFLQHVERRPGVVLNDPLLAAFQPVDLTWLTFALIYGGLILAIGVLLAHPRRLMIAFQCYAAMVVVRMIAMTLTPLDPPPTMIPLVDPTVSYFGTGVDLSRDLFFSGHTATMLLLALTAPSSRWRTVFGLATVAVAVSVLAQHAHYAIDVLAAVFFTYGSYAGVMRARAALSLPDPNEPGAGQ